MKKILYFMFLAVLSASFIACSSDDDDGGGEKPKPDETISADNIKDLTFRTYCLDNFDIDKDGSFSKDEISKTKQINISKIGNIRNLNGIEIFTELKKLICEENYYIESLDLSKNTKLNYLQCYHLNKLSTIDLLKNTAIDSLDFHFTPLNSLDLTNNANLVYLKINQSNISKLDVSKNLKLKLLFCPNNKLGVLDVANNTQLLHLTCGGNSITNIDLSKNLELKTLSCSHSIIGEVLSIVNNKKLERFDCISNDRIKHLFVWKGFDKNKFESFLLQEGTTITEQ